VALKLPSEEKNETSPFAKSIWSILKYMPGGWFWDVARSGSLEGWRSN
jgi:hypothetical protein